jgi:hypothetical protein
MEIDGVRVVFEAAEGRVRVFADGREIGSLELVRHSRELVAFRPDGEPLRTLSRFGGSITARFSSREVAARALMAQVGSGGG